MSTLADVRAVLDEIGEPYAVIGAQALAVHGYLRATIDTDIFTTTRQVLHPARWTRLIAEGAKVDAREGEFDDPLAGVVHIQLEDDTDVDVVVGKYKWQLEVLQRTKNEAVLDGIWPVPGAGDLILLKLDAGGPQDAMDVRELLLANDRAALVPHVESHLPRLPPDAGELWRRILGELG